MTNFSRVLIIKLRHHGDVLLITPLISALAQNYPNTEIDALVYAETLDMLIENKQLERCFAVDRKNNRKNFAASLTNERDLFSQLRARGYDLLIHLTESWRGALLAKLLNPKRSVGFAYPRRDNFLWRSCFSDLVKLPEAPCHNVELQLSTLTALGLNINSAKFPLHLEVSPIASERVKQLLVDVGWQKEAYVLIHPGSRWMFKCWEDNRFAELIDVLIYRGISVVLTSSPDDSEMEMIKNICQQTNKKERIYSLAGKLSLLELAAAIAAAKLFVGVDSVPMHMAAALQVPSVALFGPSKIHEWLPWQSDSTILSAASWGALPDPDCINTKTKERFLSAIPADAVIDAVLSKLEVKHA